MNGEDGWVKIHRSMWKNPWMFRPNVLAVWVYILCHVTHQKTDVVFEGKRITLEPGQGLFKMRQVAQRLDIPTTTVHRIVELLKNETQIETQKTPRNTLVTVINWHLYQGSGTRNGKQVEHKRNTSGTQNEFLLITNINKNEKNDKKYIYGEYQNVKLTDEELEKLKAEFPDWEERIERLSEYIAQKGDKYKNHLATIRAWARKDKDKPKPQNLWNNAQAGFEGAMKNLEGLIDEQD